MEQRYNELMQTHGYDQLVCDIFKEWEHVKDEILLPERKMGSGNGTIHIFLGAADDELRIEFADLYANVENGDSPDINVVEVKHFFLLSNILSMIGHVLQYQYVQREEYLHNLGEILTYIQSAQKNGVLTTTSLFKLSTGSNKLRPYFKQFESDGIFPKLIRKLLLPRSAYKISLYKNANNEYAAFWLLGFSEIDNFEATLIPEQKRLNHHHSPLQQIFYGAPGTGKSFAIKELTTGKKVIRTTFHPDSDYSTFVGCYKPTTKEVPVISNFGGKAIKVKDDNGEEIKEERIVYEFVEQAFLQAYIKAWKLFARADEGKTPEEVYLVIEEINRGNCAQIFGDLFQLLDRGENGFSEYPIMADKDMQKQLAKAFADMPFLNAPAVGGMNAETVAVKIRNGEILLLPNNLYIWATMNTSDQSLFPIDSAFKRRWDWQYVPIANAGKRWVIEVNSKQYDWWDFLEKINALIGTTTNSEDKKLGYFFCKPTNGVINAETFVSKVIFYLWNDVFKDFEFEGDVFIDDDKESKLTFDKFYRTDANGHSIVRESKVDLFLSNLGVKFAQTEEDDDMFIPEENDENSQTDSNTDAVGRDRSTFSINGQGVFNKRRLALECVKLYSDNHAYMSAQELVDVWMGLNLMRTNFIETSDAHATRAEAAKNDTHFDQRYYSFTLPNNNETVYINNQFRVESINDFIEKVNAQGWGIHIEKIN